jgi:hypothetical protein
MKGMADVRLELHRVSKPDLCGANRSSSVYEKRRGKQFTYAVTLHKLSVSEHAGIRSLEFGDCWARGL